MSSQHNYYFFNYFYLLIQPCLIIKYCQFNKFNLIFLLFLFLLSLFPYKNEANNNFNIIQKKHSSQQHLLAQGNLFIVFNVKSGRSSTLSPQMANLSMLWCQATSNGNDRLKIKEARFVKVLPKPERIHEASRYNNAKTRAYLEFDSPAPTSSIGKYRCEITIEDNENEEIRPSVKGNLFVYMRPVLLLNSSTKLKYVEEGEKGNFFSWIGEEKYTKLGEDVILECPVIGYPLPEIKWFKNGKALNTSILLPPDNIRKSYSSRLKYMLTAKALYIRSVNIDDEANYKCLATNSFPLNYDDLPREFQLILEQYLYVRVDSSMAWLLPLLIIIILIILLILIIWGCSKRDHIKRNQYNVAQKEKEHFRATGGETGGQQGEDEE